MNSKNYLNAYSKTENGKPVVPFIVGPTAGGKTADAVALAKERNGEVVSADSMQIYKHMRIGTARPTVEEMAGVPHHLINFVEPDENYSAAAYRDDAQAAIADILSRGKLPIVCGGTGLYVSALSKPYDFSTDNRNDTVRKELEALGRTDPEALYQRLYLADPISAAAIHPNNVKRVVRALEIYITTGKTKSEQDAAGQTQTLPYTPMLFMADRPREALYERINLRIDLMLEAGLEAEARALEARYGRQTMAMQAIGYKEFFPYFDAEIQLDEAVRILKRDTRHFAKRQLTWFRRDTRIRLYKPGDVQTIVEALAP